MTQGQVLIGNWNSLTGAHLRISKGCSPSWQKGYMWWFKRRATWWISSNKLLFTQFCFGWLLISAVVFTTQFPVQFGFWTNPIKTLPITNPFPQLSHILQEIGVVESGLYSGFPKYIAFSYGNLQFHAPLSSIGTGSLPVLMASKMVRLMYLSSVLLTTMSIWRDIG